MSVGQHNAKRLA